MHLNWPTVSLIFLSACVCILGFIAVVLLYVGSVKRGRKESDRLVKTVERFAHDNKDSLPVATRLQIGLYLLIALCVLGSLSLLLVVTLAYETGLPAAENVNVESLGLISAAVLLVAIVATLILRFLFGRIFKSK